jgi:hypothetical protein
LQPCRDMTAVAVVRTASKKRKNTIPKPSA